jgi:hypothetical protein
MTRRGRGSWVCGLLAAVGIATFAGLGGAEPQPVEVSVRVASAKQPAIYLRFRNNKLWMATSRAGLDKATPIRASRVNVQRPEGMQKECRSCVFPETALPLSLPGIQNVRAQFSSARWIGKDSTAPANTPDDMTYLGATFRLSRRDSSGVTWTYVLHSAADSATAQLPGRRLELVMPDLAPNRLRLEVVTQVEGNNASIGLQVKSGMVAIQRVMKGSASALATIAIVDLKGQTVVSEKGDLAKFGFT